MGNGVLHLVMAQEVTCGRKEATKGASGKDMALILFSHSVESIICPSIKEHQGLAVWLVG